MINLEWYRTFKAIYKAGTMTKAAQELLISQPNVSVQLAALESYVGKKLFERHPRKMIPTDYGKILYTQIVESIDTLEKVELAIRRSSLKEIHTLRLGVPLEFFYNNMVQYISKSKSNAIVQFGLTKDLIEQLVVGDLDFVVATQKIVAHNIVYEDLMTEVFSIVSNSNMDASEFDFHLSNGSIREMEEWLLNQVWYAYSNELPLVRRFWLENFQKRPMIKPKYIVPDLNCIAKALKHDQDGIAVLSDHLLLAHNSDNKLKKIWSGFEPVTNTICLAYNKSVTSIEHVNDLRNLLKDCIEIK